MAYGGRLVSRARAIWLLVLGAVVAALTVFACGPLASGVAQASEAEVASEHVDAASFTAYFVDVGQGDCEFLVFPDGQTMLVDAGDQAHGDQVVSFIRDTLGCDHVDYLLVTHPHLDHMGGAAAVLRSPDLSVGRVFMPSVVGDTAVYEDFVAAVAETGHELEAVQTGSVLYDAAGCRAEVLSPDADAAYSDMNDYSAVLQVTFGSTTYLFTGDAGWQVLEQLATADRVDVLKVGHHGSDTSTTIDFIDMLSPQIAVIEVGRDNDYGHPSQETLDELAYCGVQTWRTDRDGTVAVRSDGTLLSAWSLETGATQPQDPAVVATYPAEGEAPATQEGASSGEEAAGATQEDGVTVYVTETGNKYHASGCRYLKKSAIAMSLDDAVAQGYTPCAVCGG